MNSEEHNLGSEDEEELITAQKVLENIETAWMNERCSPEILPYQGDMLELMLEQISHMEQNMEELNKNGFRYISHRMELERIQYVIASYLRRRIQKIETYAKHILLEEDNRELDDRRLSEEETKYANEFHNNIEKYFQTVALQYMPNVQRSEADQRIVRPNLLGHVFIKAKVSVPAVIVGVEDEEVDLVAGSQHIIPYQLVSDLILKGQAQLI